jgi:hypothetical protein
MSAYIEFFLKRKDDEKFTCIGAFSRSHNLYEALNSYVPYENITRLTDNIYSCGKENLQNKIDEYKHTIKGYKKKYKILAKGGNFEEFEKYIEDSERWIDEAKEELKWAKWALERLEFIKELEEIDGDAEIYVGVEVGKPTVDDII